MFTVNVCSSFRNETALKNIDETKATGPDGTSPRVLKCCAYPISVYLYLIYSKSLATGL